jgi:hypothetical protein
LRPLASLYTDPGGRKLEGRRTAVAAHVDPRVPVDA